MINLELFSCAGGMAKGFADAGVHFDLAFDFMPKHCDSYERNIGHRPICMDVRDLLRMVKLGVSLPTIGLLVADPPCTPWSRSGKRLGTEDERDMIEETCELIGLLRPRAYMICNVPGLDDECNWHIVQRVIGGLSRHGYCVADFTALDAVFFGTPQRRRRPFWFGHLAGPCIKWPRPTHADPAELATADLFAGEALKPWITCRQALGHLPLDELGRPVRLRGKWANGGGDNHRPSDPDEPAKTITRNTHSDGLVLSVEPHHPPSQLDEPAMTVRAGCGGGANRALQLDGVPFRRRNMKQQAEQAEPIALNSESPISVARAYDRRRQGRQGRAVSDPDSPAATVTASPARAYGGAGTTLSWPWDRPSTTIQSDDRIAPPGHHDESYANRSLPNAVVLSQKAATILQGFPEDWHWAGETKKERWAQIGQAMPPPLSHAVATSVVEQMRAADEDAA